MYVAGYTLGRTWIEMLRIDPANHFFGLRINVFTSVMVFLGAVVFLILRRNVGREDPALVWGPARRGEVDDPAAEPVLEPVSEVASSPDSPARPAGEQSDRTGGTAGTAGIADGAGDEGGAGRSGAT